MITIAGIATLIFFYGFAAFSTIIFSYITIRIKRLLVIKSSRTYVISKFHESEDVSYQVHIAFRPYNDLSLHQTQLLC